MSDELQVLVDFAQGRLTEREFEAALYENPRFEDVLDDDPHLAPGTYVGTSVYLFVLRQNFGLPGGVLNAHGAIVQFLERNGHEIDPTGEFAIRHDLLLQAQPTWLDVPEKYLVEQVLPPLKHLQHGDLLGALKVELRRRFRYNRKPPIWLQGSRWPINENGPLVFLGQLPIYVGPDASNATIFIFRDAKTGGIQTIEQCNS